MPHLEWYYEDEELNRILVRSTGVPRVTMENAGIIGAIAASRLATHHANNASDPRPDSSITVTRGDVDAFVNLEAEDEAAAASIQKEVRAFDPFARMSGPVDHSQAKRRNTEKHRRIYGKKLYGKGKK